MLRKNKHHPTRPREKAYYKGSKLYSRSGSNRQLAQELAQHRLPPPIYLSITFRNRWTIPRDEYLAVEWLKARPMLGKPRFTIGSRLQDQIKDPIVHRHVPTCDDTLEEKLRASLIPKAS
jgi:hypothetical protein